MAAVRRRAPRGRSPPSRSGSGRPAPGTRSRSRSACSGRCSARSSRSRPDRSSSPLVERIRRRTIALRRDDDPLERARLDEELAGARPRRRGGRHRRVRALLPADQPGRGARPGPGPPPARAGGTRRRAGGLGRGRGRRPAPAAVGPTPSSTRSSGGLAVTPVLTAHPTEARRRTTLVALGRCAILLARLDDPRLTPSRGSRGPSPAARGDHAAVADLGPADRVADAARRGPDRDGLLRRDAVHGHPAAVPSARCGARPTGAAVRRTGVGHRPDRDAAAARRGVPATRELDRRRPRRQPGRHGGDHRARRCASTRTTSSTATRPWRPG